MNAFYKLACALVAWSALSLSDGALAAQPLSALPTSAFQMSQEHPERFSFVRPEVDLSHYRGVMLAPLSFITGAGDDWRLQRATADNPLDRHFRQVMSQALQAHGLTIATAAAEDVLSLRLAVAHASDALPMQTALDLSTLGEGMAHYLSRVQIVGEVADSRSGLLLTGSAELGQADAAPQDGRRLAALLDNWSQASASRIASALARQQG